MKATPEPADRTLLETVHAPAYVASVEKLCAAGGGNLNPDTSAAPGSWLAAQEAADAVVDATRRVLDGEWDRAFCSVRPPGHHARPEVLYASWHQYPFLPGHGRGHRGRRGSGRGQDRELPPPGRRRRRRVPRRLGTPVFMATLIPWSRSRRRGTWRNPHLTPVKLRKIQREFVYHCYQERSLAKAWVLWLRDNLMSYYVRYGRFIPGIVLRAIYTPLWNTRIFKFASK